MLIGLRVAHAAVLPEDRADALYHSYDGGGVEINGPSILVRKSIGKKTSVSGNYYVDSISSASIDVVTTASPYTEKREEKSASVDYLHEDTILSAGYTLSDENDFTARSVHFNFSQQTFGDLTTVNMGYSRGWDEVGTLNSSEFDETDRQQYRISVSQILSKNSVINFGWETVTDEGEKLNNPYRQVRYVNVDSENGRGYSYQLERYPQTRTSHAVSIQGKYFLAHRAALHGEFRYFRDTWGITAFNLEFGYTHPLDARWVFDVSYRFYRQQQADFYSDLYPFVDAQNYLARDKELSTFSDHSLGLGVAYEFTQGTWSWIKKGTLNLKYNYILFSYDNFRDLRAEGYAVGAEPLYSFNAHVVQIFASIWY